MDVKSLQNVILFVALLLVPTFAEKGKVTTWVPWWGVGKCKMILTDSAMGAGAQIDRLGLPFWGPALEIDGEDTVVTGAVVKEHNQWTTGVSDEDIRWFRDWGRENDVEVLMTIGYWMLVNDAMDTETWEINWELQKKAFHDNQEAFITNMLAIMDSFDLDGIDVDIEGLASYRHEYVGFVRRLADSLHNRGKIITVDVMPSTTFMNANTEWWPDFVDCVDAIHVMGYNDVYEGSEDGFGGNLENNKYSTLIEYGESLGMHSSQIALGMPAWLTEWGKDGHGTSVLSHLKELRELNKEISICLWDLQLASKAWQDSQVWDYVGRLSTAPQFTVDTMTNPDRDTLTLMWGSEAIELSKTAVVSLLPYNETAWKVLDTTHGFLGHTIDLTTVEDSLFTILVSLLDESGKIIDSDVISYDNRANVDGVLSTKSTKEQHTMITSSNRKLTLQTKDVENYSLVLYALNGSVVFEKAANTTAATTDLQLPRHIARGTYVARVVTPVYTTVKKICIVQ